MKHNKTHQRSRKHDQFLIKVMRPAPWELIEQAANEARHREQKSLAETPSQQPASHMERGTFSQPTESTS